MKNTSEENGRDSLAGMQGRVIRPEDNDYDEVRRVWNGMIDRRPALILQCINADDVSIAVQYARRSALEISIRGAGHNIAGNALCDGGVMIDLSPMKNVQTDPPRRRAYVEPGATLADLDGATQRDGLATPLGINSTTGVSGLTLGGGIGWLTRRLGMTVDNLLSADAVMADGRKLHASQDENPELFWALRGGGGNFGVVTRFEFNLHRVGPEILAGLIVFPIEQAKRVLQQYREFVAGAPEDLCVWALLRQAPPLPFLPEAIHGKPILALALAYTGDTAKGEGVIEPIFGFGDPVGRHVGVQPYAQWQQAFDPLLASGARNYWKTHNFTKLNDEALDIMTDAAAALPSPQCELFIGHIAGAANRVPANATAYVQRDAEFVMNVHARWEDAGQDEACIGWARDLFKKVGPHASGGAYVNFMTAEEGDRVKDAYGSNYARLVRAKQLYDPENLFHVNQNIRP
ncbi:FAD-binding oxidoreductase [Allopusillimonas soli]|uniref:FAD-binding oxidoreductase n=1 Tax=Allopusillimonas soli TaxID=659016 RepID=A0A853FF99_9BURK|nr:FAD-binding oxidoreductase [Allopusillimonas soli]NYT38362.1 FAD-binding oxidoreductase [Allopusillimonas soli]TEA72073.1 FAD-binding oxidoreductase [Allopusillimonas soli]